MNDNQLDPVFFAESTEVAQLPTQLQSYIHISRYARWLDGENRRETWDETVNRYAEFFKNRFPDTYPETKIANAIRNLSVMPSMRALMTAGPALDGSELAGYNCSAIAIDHVRVFDEILYVLLCGTGLGFSVERQAISKLPIVGASVVDGEMHVAESLKFVDHVIVVGDSKIGWAKAYRELLSHLYRGEVPKWDVSGVRPSGARLKTFGGRASGPQPLVDLFEFTIAKFKGALGRKLNSIECHDIVCKIADIVVVGGVRRSALISMSNLSDERLRGAKSGQWWEDNPQRALANNSVVYTEKPDPLIFMKEWHSLIESKSGERGVLNRVAMKKQAEKNGRRDASHDFLTNPCFARGTLVHTKAGHFPIENLVGKAVEVWDGNQYVQIDSFRVTGTDQPVLKVTLHDGSEIVATPYHKFILENGQEVEAKDLDEGDKLMISNAPVVTTGVAVKGAYLKGFLLGDGTANSRHPLLRLHEPKYCCEQRLIDSANELPAGRVKTNAVETVLFGDPTINRLKNMRGLSVRGEELMPWATTYKHGLPDDIYSWDIKSKAEFIAGYMDADGTVRDSVTNGYGYQVSCVSYEVLRGLQALMKSMGVQSTLRRNREAGIKDFGSAHGGVYAAQALYRLSLPQRSSVELSKLCGFTRLTNFADRIDAYTVKLKFNTVVAVSPAGVEDEVFCCTVPTNHRFAINHGVIVGNCGEISLRSAGLCNLTEVVIRAGDTLAQLKEKVEVATIMGTYQSTLTNFQYVRPIWRKNAEEERLLGVSMTGIMDHPVLSQVSDEAAKWLRELRDHAIAVNKEWAAKLGIPASAAITTVKPSGTVSQLVDSASGIHPRYAEYYIRTVRGDKKDPLAQYMRSVGFPVEDDVMKPETTDVFSFPVKCPANAVMRNDMTAIEQLEHYVQFKNNWSEHMVSITVYVREEEWVRVGAWVYDHFDDVCGVSFLPHSDHSYRQAPYTECTEEEYTVALAKMPTITSWEGLRDFEKEDATNLTKEFACISGVCEVL